MVLIVSVALKPPLILLSWGVWKGGTCYNPLNHLSIKKIKIDVNVVGRVRQSYFRVHTCSDMFHLFRYVTIFILRSFLRRQESVPVCPTSSQLSIFRLFIFQFSISNFYLLFQFFILRSFFPAPRNCSWLSDQPTFNFQVFHFFGFQFPIFICFFDFQFFNLRYFCGAKKVFLIVRPAANFQLSDSSSGRYTHTDV